MGEMSQHDILHFVFSFPGAQKRFCFEEKKKKSEHFLNAYEYPS